LSSRIFIEDKDIYLRDNLFLTGEQTIRKINELGKKSDPFIFAVDFKKEKGLVLGVDESRSTGIMYDLRGTTNVPRRKKTLKPFDFRVFPVPFSIYKKSFDKVIFHLNRGDTYLINLTFPTKIITALSLNDLFHVSDAPYKIYVPGNFTAFSPETFIRIREGRISSYPMKGTIDASVKNAEQKILADKKEIYEHNTIVDLIRNDLSMVSSGVEMDRFRYIEKVVTNRNVLLQVSSEITGTLFQGWKENLGDILFTLLPAGSVTGAPKKRTVEIIRETEIYERNFYTGIFGYFDGEDLDSAVLIRFIEEAGGGYYYKSGGGITALSKAEDEYKEMIDKVYVPVI
jgi:para-aminobenzoate synthetase component 1